MNLASVWDEKEPNFCKVFSIADFFPMKRNLKYHELALLLAFSKLLYQQRGWIFFLATGFFLFIRIENFDTSWQHRYSKNSCSKRKGTYEFF
jgi:hypothetical protein